MSYSPSLSFRRPATLVLALGLVLAQERTLEGAAQEPLPRPRAHPIALESVLDKPHAVVPERGAPGTQVSIRVSQLPAITPVWLGIGAPRLGFEALAFVLTTQEGELRHEVTVPSWAGRDRSHRFIVFDAYFRPIAITRPFHVTAQDGTVLRQGRLGEPRDTCRRLEDQDSVAYALLGADELEEDGDVIVEGTLAETSDCGPLTTLRVQRLYRSR